MTIKEICDILRAKLYNNGFEYGFIVEGRKYKPNMLNGFDEEYYKLSITIYTVQDPAVTLKEKMYSGKTSFKSLEVIFKNTFDK